MWMIWNMRDAQQLEHNLNSVQQREYRD